MTVLIETEAEILRLYNVEKWKIGTIASELHIHTEVVHRVLGLNPTRGPKIRQSTLIEPYLEYIESILKNHPKLRATRIYDMIKARGYQGSPRTVRGNIAHLRPKQTGLARFHLETMPGEEAQVDWAHVKKIAVPEGMRDLWLFVIVLSHSRALWGEFVFDLTAWSLRRSLIRAANYFKGNPRNWLFDNPKIVISERYGSSFRFHEDLVKLSSQFNVKPNVCAVRQPQQKGKVERTIRYIRERFLAGQEFMSPEEANKAFLKFLDEIAWQRIHPGKNKTVTEVYNEEEKPCLLPLPNPMPSLMQILPGKSDQCAFVRFDKNNYSVNPNHHSAPVRIMSDDKEVVIYTQENKEIGRHPRCWGKKQYISSELHRQELIRKRHQVRSSLGGQSLLRSLVPCIDVLFKKWIEDGRNTRTMIASTLNVLNIYGNSIFPEAINNLIEAGNSDIATMHILCERVRKKRNLPKIRTTEVPSHHQDRDVIQHNLENYDV